MFNQELPVDSQGYVLPVGPPVNTTSFEAFRGCFGGGPGRLEHTNGSFMVQTGDMMPGKSYVFNVTATKETRLTKRDIRGITDTRVATAERILTLIAPPAPNISVM